VTLLRRRVHFSYKGVVLIQRHLSIKYKRRW
jgi:hypothetical protein